VAERAAVAAASCTALAAPSVSSTTPDVAAPASLVVTVTASERERLLVS